MERQHSRINPDTRPGALGGAEPARGRPGEHEDQNLRPGTHMNVDAAGDEPLDLNTATADQLRRIQGLGEARVSEILKWRDKHGRFETVDDLRKLRTFTPDVITSIRSRLRVSGA